MLKVNYKDTRATSLTSCHWRRSGVFITNFQNISHLFSRVPIIDFIATFQHYFEQVAVFWKLTYHPEGAPADYYFYLKVRCISSTIFPRTKKNIK